MTAVLRPPGPTGPLSTPERPTADGFSAAPNPSLTGPPTRDPVFWTELEIRRLGNLVAASIEARVFVGPSSAAASERKQMRVYLDAMKRKAFRVLERAERFAHSPEHEWPGLDHTIADPVALAEEYTKVVEDYLAVLSAEEEAAATAAAEEAAAAAEKAAAAEEVATAAQAAIENDQPPSTAETDGSATEALGTSREGADSVVEDGSDAARPDGTKPPDNSDDWVAADDEAYREALQRERGALNAGRTQRAERTALLEEDGLRRRRGGDNDEEDKGAQGKLSAEDEELMARHQPVQDDLTANLVNLVGQLKESVADNRDKLKSDSGALNSAENAVDASLAAIKRQRENLQQFTQTTSTSWWLIILGGVMIVLVFFLVFVLLKIPL